MIEVIKPGLETGIQDLPGRIGFWSQGFPPSGPVDAWSFRLANLLVGNHRDAAALECQFVGPTLRFSNDGAIALTGALINATLDGAPVAMWETVPVRAGQILAMGAAMNGARTYLAFSGGIDTPLVLGSRSTFHMAGVGGIEGYALKAGQSMPLASAGEVTHLRVPVELRPAITETRSWEVECMVGPNDDWLDPASIDTFFSSEWAVQARSNRTGVRLTGPEFVFSSKAHEKRPEHGNDPANILSHGYPLGGINLAGQTPIILINDAPSSGGFINPFTIPAAAFWKVGQARPGDKLHFTRVDLDGADKLRRKIDAICSAENLVAR
jgi:urea carboxylase